MSAKVLELVNVIKDGSPVQHPWHCSVVLTDDNMAYVASNEQSKQVIIVDPVRGDEAVFLQLIKTINYTLVCVIDTHTHADHVSAAPVLAEQFGVPLLMHEKSPTQRAHVRVSKDTILPLGDTELKFLTTPGHTPDSLTVLWGPFIFSGDTLLYGDCGRDDLPGGNSAAHWQSLQKIKAACSPQMLLLPGHDGMGGRVSSWQKQLELNSALSLDLKGYEAEYGNYVGPSPKLLKESLYENFK